MIPSRSPRPMCLLCAAASIVLLLLVSCSTQISSTGDGTCSLPQLIVQRLSWMDEVAAIKKERGLPINDPKREAELLAAMERQGQASGIPREAVRAFFDGQMKAAKAYQEEWMLHMYRPRRKLPDLAKTVRPALDEIGKQMLSALSKARKASDHAAVLDETRRRLQKRGYSQDVVTPALQGLRDGLTLGR